MNESLKLLPRQFIATTTASVVLLFSTSVLAIDGTVNFTGEIVDTACTVDIGSSNTMTVNLGKVAKSSFTGVGSVAATTKFMMILKSCPSSVTNATVKFDGNAFNGDNRVLALNSGTGVATGVAVQLSDHNQLVLPLFSASSNISLSEGVNNIPFLARYIQMASTVTAGPANAVAQFTLNYN
ncbi:fimbrial protein [Pantoea sp. LMR881]|uniref:fimbrial protein n=1 Tax=Pantoea sp. LMR881 TaxID=3014336 RepID=UPI0022AE90A4|nr:fimbrial protein [Pantoea sp. LMR881]MCZ4060514.1 fimbrial protein [Pantoea sp. LMR881]